MNTIRFADGTIVPSTYKPQDGDTLMYMGEEGTVRYWLLTTVDAVARGKVGLN